MPYIVESQQEHASTEKINAGRNILISEDNVEMISKDNVASISHLYTTSLTSFSDEPHSSTKKHSEDDNLNKASKKVKCDDCPKKFATIYTRDSHRASAHGIGKFDCDDCGNVFAFEVSSYSMIRS